MVYPQSPLDGAVDFGFFIFFKAGGGRMSRQLEDHTSGVCLIRVSGRLRPNKYLLYGISSWMEMLRSNEAFVKGAVVCDQCHGRQTKTKQKHLKCRLLN